MNYSIYMKIDGMKGDQTHLSAQDEYSLLSFDTGVSSSDIAGNAGSGAGKVKFDTLKITRQFHSASSADLNTKVANGTPTQTLEINIYNEQDALVAKLQAGNVMFISLRTTFASGQFIEQIECSYGKMKWIGSTADRTGAVHMQAGGGWDMTRNVQF